FSSRDAQRARCACVAAPRAADRLTPSKAVVDLSRPRKVSARQRLHGRSVGRARERRAYRHFDAAELALAGMAGLGGAAAGTAPHACLQPPPCLGCRNSDLGERTSGLAAARTECAWIGLVA